MSSSDQPRSSAIGPLFRLGWLCGLAAGAVAALTVFAEKSQDMESQEDSQSARATGARVSGSGDEESEARAEGLGTSSESVSTSDAPL